MISAKMIVMVVQPHPIGGMVARWHGVPGGAGLLPADVSTFLGDIIFNSLVAYTMGAGRTRMAPGKQAEKDGGKTKLKNVVAIWLSPGYWWSSSSIVFWWAMPRMIMLKTGRTMLSPASSGGMGMTPLLSGTLLFSFLSAHLPVAFPYFRKRLNCEQREAPLILPPHRWS